MSGLQLAAAPLLVCPLGPIYELTKPTRDHHPPGHRPRFNNSTTAILLPTTAPTVGRGSLENWAPGPLSLPTKSSCTRTALLSLLSTSTFSLTFPSTPTSIHLISPPSLCAIPLNSQSTLLAPVESLIVQPYDHSSTGCCPLLHQSSHPLVIPAHHRHPDRTLRS